MGRSRAIFRQSDLVRAVKAALACGLKVERTVIEPDGRIELVYASNAAEPIGMSELEIWKAKKYARAAQRN